MKAAIVTSKESPLTLRYLLHIHSGPALATRCNTLHEDFSNRGLMKLTKGSIPHIRWQVIRE